MGNEVLLLVVGGLLPPVIDLVNKFVPNSHGRFLVSVVFAFVVGAILAFFQYGTDEVLANAGVIFVAAQAVYKLWYKESGIHARIVG